MLSHMFLNTRRWLLGCFLFPKNRKQSLPVGWPFLRGNPAASCKGLLAPRKPLQMQQTGTTHPSLLQLLQGSLLLRQQPHLPVRDGHDLQKAAAVLR
ncbi:unnamed protein product, partial [Amoebophrya sp. A120]|eukprot:GSA120T00010515001.1